MTEHAKAQVRFVFNVCNDIAAMRHFYVEILGLNQESYMDTPEFGWLATGEKGFSMMWFRADDEQSVPTTFACQPGWAGGTVETTSWGIQVPEERFAEVLATLRQEGAPMFADVPEWRQDSYWGLSVLDPMGVTVEVYATPAERPADTTWPG